MALASWGAITGNVLLFALVCGLASTVERKSFRRSLKSRGLLIGIFAQFVFLPLFGFVLAKTMFGDAPELGVPLIITTSSPGGSFSNWWTSLFNGDLSLSVAMTTVSSILSVGLLPLNLFIYIKGAYSDGYSDVQVSWAGLFVSIAVVIAGIGVGLYVGERVPSIRSRMNIVGNACGLLLVLLGFFFSSNSSAPLWKREWKFYVGLMIPCVMALVISLGFARLLRLEMPQALAVAIEVCYQNTAIALAVILSSFNNDSCEANGQGECDIVGIAAGVPTYYQFLQVISLGILCLVAWRFGWTYAPKGTPLVKAITTNFQPSHDERDARMESDADAGELGAVEDGVRGAETDLIEN